MSIMRFNRNHQWLRLDASEAVVGITDYALEQLGEVVHVDLPRVGALFEQGKEIAAIESVKVSNGLDAPISGEITAINAALSDDTTKINTDPTCEGWLFKLRVSDSTELDALMDEAAYKKFVDTL